MSITRYALLAILLAGMVACSSSAPDKSIAYEDPPATPTHARPNPGPASVHAAAADPAMTPAIGGQTFAQVSVSQLTNCRSGPGLAYDFVLSFLPGQTARLLARNPSLGYLVINTPTGGACWLWAQFATITGDLSGIPTFFGPALPTGIPSATDTATPTNIPPTAVPPTSTQPPPPFKPPANNPPPGPKPVPPGQNKPPKPPKPPKGIPPGHNKPPKPG